MMHVDLGKNVLNRASLDLAALGELEQGPSMEGRIMSMIIRPKK